jgi:nitroreductase
MTVEQAIKARRSIRQYDPDAPVAEEDLMKILEAGRLAPSGINMQSWVFVVVRDPQIKERLAAEAMALPQNTAMCRQAPVVIVCCAQLDAARELPERLRELAAAGVLDQAATDEVAPRYQAGFEHMAPADVREYAVLNLTIAATQMVLQATALGYGTCWLKGFAESRVRRILNLPDRLHVSSIIPVGRPAEDPPPRKRKSLDEIVVWDTFPADTDG